jgi:glycosyltransferase involved in cell wall biosynthesis
MLTSISKFSALVRSQGFHFALIKAQSYLFAKIYTKKNKTEDQSNESLYKKHKEEQYSYISESIKKNLFPSDYVKISRINKKRKILLYPLSYNLKITQRPDHILKFFSKHGYTIFILEINSETSYIKQFKENIFLTNMAYQTISFFKEKEISLYITYPFFNYMSYFFKNAKVIYDVLDDLTSFNLYCPSMTEDHIDLLKNADITFFSSEILFNKNIKHQKNKTSKSRNYLIENGVWIDDFVLSKSQSKRINQLEKNNSNVYIGYHGAISEYLDWNLLKKITLIQNVKLILIGPIVNFSQDTKKNVLRDSTLNSPNVIHIDLIPYNELKEYIKYFDIALIPFSLNEVTQAVSPLKLFEYIAMKKRVFATPTDTLLKYSKIISVMPPKDLLRNIENIALQNNKIEIPNYSSILKKINWEEKLLPVLKFLESKKKSKVNNIFNIDFININFYDWDGKTIYKGGAERYIFDLCKKFQSRGFFVRILQNANKKFYKEFKGIPVIGIPGSKILDFSVLSKAFANACKDADLIIASPMELACNIKNKRIISINHGIHWDSVHNEYSSSLNRNYNEVFNSLVNNNKIVAVDTNFINWVRTYDRFLAEKILYIPNYYNELFFKPFSKNFKQKKLKILYPRRLYEPRGIYLVMRAFDYLFNKFHNIELHLIGQIDKACEKEVSAFYNLHQKNVFLAEYDMDKMYLAYQNSHIVLIPTLASEGTSLSCIEAMASNNGVIATNVGGLPNLIINNFNGLLINPTVNDLIISISHLINDRSFLKNLASNAIKTSKTFEKRSWELKWISLVDDIKN